jgi:predicted nuclease with TOPRIM domain
MQELEEKYKKAAVSNAQLDNEKQTLKYQVDNFKDLVDELEESNTEAQRLFKDKARVRIYLSRCHCRRGTKIRICSQKQ